MNFFSDVCSQLLNMKLNCNLHHKIVMFKRICGILINLSLFVTIVDNKRLVLRAWQKETLD
jgi:hypothetical protein